MSSSIGSRTGGFICRSRRHSIQSQLRRRRYATTTSGKLTSATQPDIYDVLTVGGGPVGLALLAALKSSPTTAHLKCALIEVQDLSRAQSWKLPTDKYSNRASSLTPTNISFLESIGAWQYVDHSRVQPYDEMQVWDASNDAAIQFDWKTEAIRYNAPLRTIATMTENSNLVKGLLDRLSSLEMDDHVHSSTSVASIENGTDDPASSDLSTWPVLTLKSTSSTSSASAFPSHADRRVAARLLVGADGLNSPVRTFAGITSHGWDYNRHGLVATLKVQYPDPSQFIDPTSLDSFLDDSPSMSSNRATAFQRFLPALGGPIAILPLPDNYASLVWSTTPQTATYMKSLSPEAFVATINAALRLSQTDVQYFLTLPPSSSSSSTFSHEDELSWRLQHASTPSSSLTTLPPTVTAVQEGTVASFPLRLRQSSSYVAPHVALAGDAAHTIHPLAGQGLNLGLADASALARTIEYAVERGMDIGHPMTLERYAAERFGKGLLMAGGVDALNWMYQLGGPNQGEIPDGLWGTAVGKLRGLGMSVVGGGWVPGLKEFIMRRAD